MGRTKPGLIGQVAFLVAALPVLLYGDDKLIPKNLTGDEVALSSLTDGKLTISLQSTAGDAAKFNWTVVEIKDGKSKVFEDPSNASEITITPAANTTYVVTLMYESAGDEKVVSQTFAASADKLVVLRTAKAEAPAPVVAPPAAPKPADDPLEKMSVRLQGATAWAKQVASYEKLDRLIVPIEFFQEQLTKKHASIGNMNIKEAMQRPVLDAQSLYRAVSSMAENVPADAATGIVQQAWAEQKQAFLLTTLINDNREPKEVVVVWEELLSNWEKRILTTSPDQFREALIQGSLCITGLLLEYDELHIRTALTTNVAATSGQSGSTSPASGTSYHSYHHSYHHEKILRRIHRRHERRMARLGY